MKCERGLCLVCEKEIAKTCSACGAFSNTKDYVEVELTWSNKARMAVPVCTDCSKEKVWKSDKKEMTKAIWDAWDKQGGKYDKAVVIV